MVEDVIYNSIVAAAVSIIVTAITELIVNRTEERRSKRVYKNSLLKEVENNFELLKKDSDDLRKSDNNKQREEDKMTLILYSSVFDSMISSGNLSLFDEKEQKRLQEIYSIIKQNNEYVKIFTTIKHLHLPPPDNNYLADASSSDISQMEQWIEHNHSRIAKMLSDLIKDVKHSSRLNDNSSNH